LLITFGTVNFDEYLISKKIDQEAFKKAEPTLFQTWNEEFGQMHVNSFTVQKLNLINPIRRRFQLKEISKSITTPVEIAGEIQPPPQASAAPRVAKPVMKPKPKIN
jgi:hypothetical protein